MPDNRDAIMVVVDGSTPNANWTYFSANDFSARRVAFEDYKKLHAHNKKVISMFIFQFNQSGPNPFKSEINGRPTYGLEYNEALQCVHVSRFKPQGSGNGCLRRDFMSSTAGGGQTGDEDWDGNVGQVPAQGVVLQDASPTQAKLDAAAALTTDDVPLG